MLCAPAEVLNRGIGGQNSTEGRARFDRDVLAEHPRYVLIFFGVNDALNEKKFVSVNEFSANLQWMVQRALENHFIPVLCTIHSIEVNLFYTRHPRSLFTKESPNAKIERYNGAIRRLAHSEHVPLAEFALAFQKAGGATLDAKSLIQNPANSGRSDGVHLVPAGYELLAKTLYREIPPGLSRNDKIVCFGDSLTFGTGVDGNQSYPAVLRRLLGTD